MSKLRDLADLSRECSYRTNVGQRLRGGRVGVTERGPDLTVDGPAPLRLLDAHK